MQSSVMFRRSDASAPDLHDALLTMADAGFDSRVVVMAPNALELACALLRRGTRDVTMAQSCARLPAGSTDIVILPRLCADTLASALASVRRILAPLGSVVAGLEQDGDGPSTSDVTTLLKASGFSRISIHIVAGAVILRGEMRAMTPVAADRSRHPLAVAAYGAAR